MAPTYPCSGNDHGRIKLTILIHFLRDAIVMTYSAIARRFKDGETVEDIMIYQYAYHIRRVIPLTREYVEHAIREVMRKEKR